MKKLVVCFVVLALVGSAQAQQRFDDGAVHDLTTQTYPDHFWISDGTTVNIGDGVTVNISTTHRYPTTYIGILDNSGHGIMNISGTGQLIMDTGHASGLADSVGTSGELNMSGDAYLETAGMAVSQRGDSVVTLSDNAEIYMEGGVNAGGANYSGLGLVLGNNHAGTGTTAILNQSGSTTITVVDGGVVLGGMDGGTGIYNMSGGLLTAPSLGAGAGTAEFNFSGGTIVLNDGTDQTGVINQDWWNGAAMATYDGQVTTIEIPEPMTLSLLGIGGLLLRRRRR